MGTTSHADRTHDAPPAAPPTPPGITGLAWRVWVVARALFAPLPAPPPLPAREPAPPTALEHAVRVWGTARLVRGAGHPLSGPAALHGRTPMSRHGR